MRLVLVCLGLTLAACEDTQEPVPEPIRPVRVVSVEPGGSGETASLTGTIEAEEEVSLAFRISGRMIERTVNIGDTVTAGQRIGRLQSTTQVQAVHAARADLTAAMGELARTTTDFGRQQSLIVDGFTTRVRYDEALQAMRVAQAWVDTAEARLAIAEQELSYTELYADAPGVVTARGAEPGEVVAAGQMVVLLARKGGRDAVFDVPERLKRAVPLDPRVAVALASDPGVRASGRVREIGPQADPVTRTFEVKVGLIDPPDAMRLGSTVIGTVHMNERAGIDLPASALTAVNGAPAVFVVDAETGTVDLRPVRVARHDLATVVIEDGLGSGEFVVTAGVQALRPGQRVRMLGTAP
jgi:RND family efflux transporter MFP subunit